MTPTDGSDSPAARTLELLKRRGSGSIPELARAFDQSPESVRAQVRALLDEGLVEDVGSRRRGGRGRPERVYALTRRAEARFPRREGEVLRGLASYLRELGREEILASFLERFAAQRLNAAQGRLAGLAGRDRLDEVARILTEEGYMAEVRDPEEGEDGTPRLRLCHCPVRELVDVTRAPCRAEVAFVRSLVQGSLARVEYLPDGDAACSYAVGLEARG
ncbi:MAG: transcriptional regulator [Gemmatimonadota bacterium]